MPSTRPDMIRTELLAVPTRNKPEIYRSITGRDSILRVSILIVQANSLNIWAEASFLSKVLGMKRYIIGQVSNSLKSLSV